MKPKINRAGSPHKSHKMDRCQTPPYALGPLFPYLDPSWHIWEPAQGEKLLVAALQQRGFRVTGTDILTGHDFFTFQLDEADALITNPPYLAKYKWLPRCYELQIPFALLVPLEMLGAASAQVHIKQHGAEVIFMDKRVDFKMPDKGWMASGAQFPVIWLTHGLNIGRDMTFATLDKPNAQRRAEMAAGVEQMVLFHEVHA